MPEYTVIVTISNVVRARGVNDARRRIEEELDRAIQEIAHRDWYLGLSPEVEYYVERLER